MIKWPLLLAVFLLACAPALVPDPSTQRADAMLLELAQQLDEEPPLDTVDYNRNSFGVVSWFDLSELPPQNIRTYLDPDTLVDWPIDGRWPSPDGPLLLFLESETAEVYNDSMPGVDSTFTFYSLRAERADNRQGAQIWHPQRIRVVEGQ